MGKIEKFEDLAAWTKARALTHSIYEVSKQGAFGKDFGLANQMQRATVSIMSNIAEGFERRSAAEFCQFLTIAKASCAELRSQLYVAFDCGYVDRTKFEELSRSAEEVARIIGGLRASVDMKRQLQKNGNQNI
ncbi:MAG: four helix bundle protein [Chloroflexota bacterium]